MIITFLQILPTPTTSFKDYFPLLGPFLILITFTIDRIYAYKIRKKEAYRSFYMKTIVEPSLEKIEDFFDTTLEIFSTGFTDLKKISKTTPQYKKLHIKTNQKFQDKKRKFEFQVVIPAEATIEKLFGKLYPLINDLEDEFVIIIDSIDSPNDLLTQFRNSLSTIKSKFILELYYALNSKKK